MSPYVRTASSAVRVARTSAGDVQRTLAPRRAAGPVDLHPLDGPVAALRVEPGEQRGRQQPDLGGPGGRVGPHREDAVGEPLRLAVIGDLGSDDGRPPGDDAADSRLALPPALLDEPV